MHTATLLTDGKVLVVGGWQISRNDILATAEVYDPSKDNSPAEPSWTSVAPMSETRRQHTATLLANGDVLVVGGFGWSGVDGGQIRTAEIYDPHAIPGVWKKTTTEMPAGRQWHTATRLGDKVLVAGGMGTPTSQVYAPGRVDPAAGSWSVPVDLPGRVETYWHSATDLASGDVLLAGGRDSRAASVYSVYSKGTWKAVASMNHSRGYGTAVRLSNGKVLVAGGSTAEYGANFTHNSAELYDPTSQTWSFTASMNTARAEHTATVLLDGTVLVAGGWVTGGSSAGANTSEIYTP
jgi:N-acetylneuraminic acid mutarotase